MSNNQEFETNIAFDLPKNQSNVIKVIGVGGGGSNAINHMFQQGIKGVDFVICNTDAQALQNSGVPIKIQLGVNLTEGLGAGANPDVGEKAAVESFDDIQSMLDTNTKMIFITAGMGGGTGTGAAPIIAKMAKDLDILTVGIVTMPFQFEGKMRNEQAQKGVENLRDVVDSLIVINNNKLREVYGNLGFKAGFSKADEVLSTAARGIAEVITHHYTQNIDLRDAKTVLSNSGTAIMGSATASGQNRAQDAIQKALDSPLLNDNKITGAKNVLLLIVSGSQEITIDEIGEINDHIQSEAGHVANIIMGVGEDQSLEEAISVTIIATGFDIEQQNEISNTEVKKVIHSLEEEQSLEKDLYKKQIQPEPIIETNNEIKTTEEPTIIKHTLDFNTAEATSNAIAKMDLIPTSELIKNLPVVDAEVIASKEKLNTIEETPDSEFIITTTPQTNLEEDITPNDDEQQITLSFDMPLGNKNEAINNTETNPTEPVLKSNINNITVHQHEEITSNTEANPPKEIRYTLEIENEENSTSKNVKEETFDSDLATDVVFEKKIIAEQQETTENEQQIDPIHSPISEMLKNRAAERRKKMKDFNYKFNHAKIDDIEKIPAYKRQGVDLADERHSATDSEISSTSLSTDDNDDMQIRNNNSYLHDNVD